MKMKLGEKIYSLAYADDVILIAENEGEMRSIVQRLERYIEKKKLELNEKKTKIMRFRKEGKNGQERLKMER